MIQNNDCIEAIKLLNCIGGILVIPGIYIGAIWSIPGIYIGVIEAIPGIYIGIIGVIPGSKFEFPLVLPRVTLTTAMSLGNLMF